METPKFKMRASKAGLLLVKGKNQHEIGAGLITYVQDYLRERWLGFASEVTAYSLERGNLYEDDAIDLVSLHLYGFYKLEKNQEFRSDDHFTGTCDVVDGDTIRDTKVAVSEKTMPYFEDKLDKDYLAQGQVYMGLYGAKRHAVHYCLMPGDDLEIDAKIEDLPLYKRIVTFGIEKDEQMIQMFRDKIDAINEHYVPKMWERLMKLKK